MEAREKVRLSGGFHSKYPSGGKYIICKAYKKNKFINAESLKTKHHDISDWISALSHEFRTPLNVILSTLQVAQMNHTQDNEYKQIKIKYLDIMKQNCLRLLKMVNNLIDINRIDSDFFHIDASNADIVAIIKEITLSVYEYAQMKNIHVSFESSKKEHILACDNFQLERILLNLLSNAIKFTPVDGRIHVGIDITDEKVNISVSDSGSGVPRKYQDSIFERFGQTDGKSFIEKKGSGMGLYLVKKLLKKMDGDIFLSSKEGKGSTFTFFLPNIRLPQTLQESNPKGYEDNRIECLKIEFSDIYIQ